MAGAPKTIIYWQQSNHTAVRQTAQLVNNDGHTFSGRTMAGGRPSSSEEKQIDVFKKWGGGGGGGGGGAQKKCRLPVDLQSI